MVADLATQRRRALRKAHLVTSPHRMNRQMVANLSHMKQRTQKAVRAVHGGRETMGLAERQCAFLPRHACSRAREQYTEAQGSQ